LQRTLTRKHGRKIRWHSSRRAKLLESPPTWNGHDPEMGVTSGPFSIRR
jgi:hypothetical protein